MKTTYDPTAREENIHIFKYNIKVVVLQLDPLHDLIVFLIGRIFYILI